MSGVLIKDNLTQEMLLKQEFGNGVISTARETMKGDEALYSFVRVVKGTDTIVSKKSWQSRRLTKEEFAVEWQAWTNEVNARCV